MSILIKDMKMPKEEKISLTIFPDGRVYKRRGDLLRGYGEDCIPWKAFPVPPHGRLIDADGEVVVNVTMMPCNKCRVDLIAPTIIPAEEGKT